MERNAAGETIRPSPRNAVILLESEIVKEAEERRRLIRGARRAKHTMTSSLSELELRRLENIERNVQYMKELGISPSGVRRSDGTAKRSRSAPKRSAPSVAKEQEQETQFVRRSSRIAQLKEVDYEEVSCRASACLGTIVLLSLPASWRLLSLILPQTFLLCSSSDRIRYPLATGEDQAMQWLKSTK